VPAFDYDDEGDELDEEDDMAFESLLLSGSQRYSQAQRTELNGLNSRTSGGQPNRRHDAAFWESVAGLFARLRRSRHSHPHSQHQHIHQQQHFSPRGYDAIPPPSTHFPFNNAPANRTGISEEDDALLLADQEDAVQELTEAQIQEIVEKAAAQQAPL
jgi:hypothetical protein